MQSIKKMLLREQTYIDKNFDKHKHNYINKYLLVVTNKNIHASANYYNKKEYYIVLKCDKCNSFIPDILECNFNHHVMDDINKNLPVISANTMEKCPLYNFSKLTDVTIEK